MAASYPSAIWSPAVIADGTDLEADLFNRTAEELDAIEQEMGVEVHGDSGSIAERLDMVIDRDGAKNILKIADAAQSGKHKRIRAGVESVDIDDLTDLGSCGEGTVTFEPSTIKTVNAYLTLQLVSDDPELKTDPHSVCFVQNSGTTTSFDFRVSSANNAIPSPGTSFLLHWIVIEDTFSNTGDYDGDGNLFAQGDGNLDVGDYYLTDAADINTLSGDEDSSLTDPCRVVLEDSSGLLEIEDGNTRTSYLADFMLKEDAFRFTLEDGTGDYLLDDV